MNAPLFDTDDTEHERNDHDWDATTAVGHDTRDYSDDPRLQPGSGFVGAAGFYRIVELARNHPHTDDLCVKLETPSSRECSPCDDPWWRAKHLLEKDNSGAITLLKPDQFEATRQRDRDVRKRIEDGEGTVGAVWVDGNLESVSEADDEDEGGER